MKSDSNETILLLGAVLFWAVALTAASVFVTVAALWGRIEGLIPRTHLGSWGNATHRDSRS